MKNQARDIVRALNRSSIREVADVGMGQQGVDAFWFGESDEITHEAIRQAAIKSLQDGDTFYSQNLGIPDLRESIKMYSTNIHGVSHQRSIAITNSGMSALMIAIQAIVDPGDEVSIITPVWPNLVEIPKIIGGVSVREPLRYENQRWQLDLDHLLSSLTRKTKAVLINSPNNPTGWTISTEEQKVILDHCRKQGIWIIADDAYERLHYSSALTAPSFLPLVDEEDRFISVNTFSKTWQMTGWRLGWINMPKSLEIDVGTLIEYNTSCAPVFIQRAGVTALSLGEEPINAVKHKLRHSRDHLLSGLRDIESLELSNPEGAMYLFIKVSNLKDSLLFTKELVRKHGLGLAPGQAFGPEGEGYVRWCFATSTDRLELGLEKIKRIFKK